MEIPLSVGQCLAAFAALQALGAEALPLPLAVKIGRLRRAVQPTVEAYHEAREQVAAQYAIKGPDGAAVVIRTPAGQLTYEFTPGEQEAFQKVSADALKETVTLTIPAKLAANDFPDTVRGDELVIAGNVLADLGPLFDAG